MFSYDVISHEQAERERNFLLEDGIYNFEVKSAKFKMSSTGNPMISLMLNIFDNEGGTHVVFDNLISASRWRWKTRKFCESIGLLSEFENKTFNENLCPGQSGKCKITTSVWKNKLQNSVEDYLLSNAEVTQKSKPLTNDEPFEDDEIPF